MHKTFINSSLNEANNFKRLLFLLFFQSYINVNEACYYYY